jgi:hypothetical protein
METPPTQQEKPTEREEQEEARTEIPTQEATTAARERTKRKEPSSGRSSKGHQARIMLMELTPTHQEMST